MLGEAKAFRLTGTLSYIASASKKVDTGTHVVSAEHEAAQLV